MFQKSSDPLNSVSGRPVSLRSSQSRVYLLKDRNPVGPTASRSGILKMDSSDWSNGIRYLNTIPSIPNPTLSLIPAGPYLGGLPGEELRAYLAQVPLAPRRLQRDAHLGVLDGRGEGDELGVALCAVAVRRVTGPGRANILCVP